MARDRRGQSNVIGIALLLGVTVLALGGLTATIGAVIESNAESADAARVADGLAGALDPVETTGRHRGRLAFTDGSLRTVPRELRVLDANGVRRTVDVDALVFETDDHRVAFLAGAVVQGWGAGADLLERPPITASRGSGGVLVVGAPRLGQGDGGDGDGGEGGDGDGGDGGDVSVAGSGGVTLTVRTDVHHEREALGRGRYRVAVETSTPDPWERRFRRQGANVSLRDFDDDGHRSVVADYPGERMAYLVVHEMNLEVDA